MPWKLAVFLATLLCATLFIGFNLDNRCDVSWIFGTFRDVPIFVSLLFAFTAGVLASVPFKLRSRRDQVTSVRGGAKKKGSFSGSPSPKRGTEEGL